MAKLDIVNANNVIESNPQRAYFKLKNTGGPKGDKGDTGERGPQGATGPQGPAGLSASVKVGSTTTLNPGADATVTNSGDSHNVVLDFGIPTGAQGPKGDTGSQGPRGPQGFQGPKGDTGAAATVQVGNTNTGAPGTNAQVTNVGTQYNAKLNFTIPRGDKGDTGSQGPQGPQGNPGVDGKDGVDGFSPTATVTQEGLNAEIEITDKDGSTSATVPGFGVQVVDNLPATGSSNVIYLERDSTTVSGNPITITDAVDAPLADYEILGDTTQNTLTGKNLFKVQDSSSSVSSGVTYTKISDTSFSIKSDGETTWQRADVTLPTALATNSSYTIKVNFTSTDSTLTSVRVAFRSSSAEVASYDLSNGGTATVSTGASEVNLIRIYVSLNTAHNATTTFTNVQLEAGSSVTSFEPYCGGVPSPNPSYPQTVNTVTGEQTVQVCGKNLFDNQYYKTHKSDFENAYQGYYFAIELGNEFKNQITASMAVSGTAQSNLVLALTDSIGTAPANDNRVLATNGTITTRSFDFRNSSHVYLQIGATTQQTALNTGIDAIMDNYNIQIELGSTATTYEPYQGQSYEVNLDIPTGKNLLNPNWSFSRQYYGTDGTLNDFYFFALFDKYFDIEPNTAYSFSSSHSNQNMAIAWFDDSKTFISRSASGTTSISETSPANARYARLQIRYDADTVITTALLNTINLQFEKGAVSSYEPYRPIELCGIGTYRDYIWNDNGTWKIHKAIGKYVTDGNTVWTKSEYGTNNYYYRPYPITLDGSTPPNQNSILVLSDYFNGVDYNSRTSVIDNMCYTAQNPAQMNVIFCRNTPFNTTDDITNFCANNTPIFYYVLYVQTDTTITNDALIAQLNAILSARTQVGMTNIALTPTTGTTGSLEVGYYNAYASYLWVNGRWEKFAMLSGDN